MLFFQPVEHPEVKHFPPFSDLVPCGFLSPVQDYVERRIDLDDLLVQHPSATRFVKSSGDSMMRVGIGAGDLLVADSARKATHGSIVIVTIEGEFTVRRLQLHPVVMLKSGNNTYAPTVISGKGMLDIFDVVTFIIKSAG